MKEKSNNKQSSSVEWFAEKTFNLIGLMKRNWVSHGEFLDGMLKLRDEAKAMHKEEIEDAHWYGGQDVPIHESTCEQYYNERFGGNR